LLWLIFRPDNGDAVLIVEFVSVREAEIALVKFCRADNPPLDEGDLPETDMAELIRTVRRAGGPYFSPKRKATRSPPDMASVAHWPTNRLYG
jgi:hypothetical protein